MNASLHSSSAQVVSANKPDGQVVDVDRAIWCWSSLQRMSRAMRCNLHTVRSPSMVHLGTARWSVCSPVRWFEHQNTGAGGSWLVMRPTDWARKINCKVSGWYFIESAFAISCYFIRLALVQVQSFNDESQASYSVEFLCMSYHYRQSAPSMRREHRHI